MTAAQLRLLLILALELITNAVEELDVALVGVLAESRDERPGHGARGLAGNRCVGAACCQKPSHIIPEKGITYEVCVSFDPLHIMTSAGLVFVRKFFLYTSSPLTAFLNRLVAPPIILPISPRA
jgi:hypothetical protein